MCCTSCFTIVNVRMLISEREFSRYHFPLTMFFYCYEIVEHLKGEFKEQNSFCHKVRSWHQQVNKSLLLKMRKTSHFENGPQQVDQTYPGAKLRSSAVISIWHLACATYN